MSVAPPPAQCDAKYGWLGGRLSPPTTTARLGIVAVRGIRIAPLLARAGGAA